jgi:hypothetical protein
MRPSARQQELPLEIPIPPKRIPLAEAQRRLDVSPEIFTRLLCTGRLPVVYLGRKVRIADTVLLPTNGRFSETPPSPPRHSLFRGVWSPNPLS